MRFIDKETIEKALPKSLGNLEWWEGKKYPEDECLTSRKGNEITLWSASDIATEFLGEFPEVAIYINGGIAVFDSEKEYEMWLKNKT